MSDLIYYGGGLVGFGVVRLALLFGGINLTVKKMRFHLMKIKHAVIFVLT